MSVHGRGWWQNDLLETRIADSIQSCRKTTAGKENTQAFKQARFEVLRSWIKTKKQQAMSN